MDSSNIDLEAQFHDLREMWAVLMLDVIKCQDELGAAKGPEAEAFWRRTYTRTVFAGIEGSCEMFKLQAFVAEANKISNGGQFSPGKFSVLGGETFSVNDSGEIKAQPFRTSFLNNLLFSLRSYQEALGVKHRTCKGDQWHRVLDGLKVRHRITHPKKKDALEITDKEITDVAFTLGWFMGEVETVLKKRDFKANCWIRSRRNLFGK